MILSFLSSPDSKAQSLPLRTGFDLTSAPVNKPLIVVSLRGLDAEQESYLRAYGLLPGREVRVLQRFPEIVVQLEHTELAFEREVAAQVQVRLG